MKYSKQQPNFKYEKKLWKKGFKIIAGVDEVGRGCFAGAVVASAVAFAPSLTVNQLISESVKIDDSKKLTSRQRDFAEKWIKENALAWGVGEASTPLINRVGIGKATKVAFRRAIANTNHKIDFLIIDAFYIPYVKGLRRKNQLAIVDGDEKSVSIAAASIIAKVYRDKKLLALSRKPKYKKYGWGRNKGYGTREHQNAIKKFGLTRYHRKKFIETFFRNTS